MSFPLMLSWAIHKDEWSGPLAMFHVTPFAKSREKGWALRCIPLSQCRGGRRGLTGQNQGRNPEGSSSTRGLLLLILQLAQYISPCLPITPAGKWGGGRGERNPEHHPSCLPLARRPLYVRGLSVSVLIFHFPEVSRCEGRGMLPHGFPNPPVSSDICGTPLPSTRLGQVFTNICCPRAAPPLRASPSSDDRASR